MKSLIGYPKAPYIKFVLIATSIEFLGACMDHEDWTPKTKNSSFKSRNIRLTEKMLQQANEHLHLKIVEKQLVLVLEDFYKDLFKACNELKKLHLKNKLPNRKLEDDYIHIVERKSK